MSHDSRTIGSVLAAVLLVLMCGTAVSLAVAGGSTTDAEAVAAQETTTINLNDTDTANVTFEAQQSGGEQIVVDSAYLPEGGFVVVHNAEFEDAPVDSVIGSSRYLEPGTHENVTITLAQPINESQTLAAMAHKDTNENQVLDYVISEANVDGPYAASPEDLGQLIYERAEITVEGEETTTADGEETTTAE